MSEQNVAKILQRYSQAAIRLGGYYYRQMLLSLVKIPWLHLHKKLQGRYTILPAYQGIVLLDKKRVHKVAFGNKSTIKIEFNNRAKAIHIWPGLDDILIECEFVENWCISYLGMPRYHQIELGQSTSHALTLYRLMRSCCSPSECKFNLDTNKQIQSGLEVIHRLYSEQDYILVYKHLRKFIDGKDYHVGFAHGDFHSRNIVLDSSGAPHLLDLDCLRYCGIQELDALYFTLEYQWSKDGTLWYQTLEQLLGGKINDDCNNLLDMFGLNNRVGLCVTYLIDRIGQEKKSYGYEYTRAMLDPAVNAIVALRHKAQQEGISG